MGSPAERCSGCDAGQEPCAQMGVELGEQVLTGTRPGYGPRHPPRREG